MVPAIKHTIAMSVLAAIVCTLSVPAAAKAAFMQPDTITRHSFTLNPGGKFIFSLPSTQRPIFIMISLQSTAGGTQTPSEVFYAVLDQNPNSGQLTWIGTNSDGSQSAGTTVSTFTICSAWAGSPPSFVAQLTVNGAMTSNQLEVSQSNVTTTHPIHYTVTMFS
jgi:hypothetical protein